MHPKFTQIIFSWIKWVHLLLKLLLHLYPIRLVFVVLHTSLHPWAVQVKFLKIQTSPLALKRAFAPSNQSIQTLYNSNVSLHPRTIKITPSSIHMRVCTFNPLKPYSLQLKWSSIFSNMHNCISPAQIITQLIKYAYKHYKCSNHHSMKQNIYSTL